MAMMIPEFLILLIAISDGECVDISVYDIKIINRSMSDEVLLNDMLMLYVIYISFTLRIT